MSTLKFTNELIERDFPELWSYLESEEVTDVDFNCGNIWVSTIYEIPKKVENIEIDEKYMKRFSIAAGKAVNCNFNPKEHTACTETENLRITCVHESQSRSGISVCIRKFAFGLRRSREELLKTGYCTSEIMNMIDNSVRSGRSLFICGLPGHGKTESMKIWASAIPKHEKVVTIQDVGEINYPFINPGSSCSELKVIDGNYKECQETALRMNPQHILYGESRGKDAIYLLECCSNGIPLMTTLHTNDARNVTDRMLNMLNDRRDSERIVNQLYNDIGLSILVKRKINAGGKLIRYIDQVCFYTRKDGENILALAVEDGKLYKERIPRYLKEEIEKTIGCDLFEKKEEVML